LSLSRAKRAPGRIKPADIVLVALVIAASVATMVMITSAKATEKGSVAVIEVNGKPVERITLGQGQPDRLFMIHGFTGWNLVEVKDGRVRVKNSDCRDKVCVGMGWIDTQGRSIVCLPHRVVIRVTGKRGGKGKVDSVTE
jgi:hypothetical protein